MALAAAVDKISRKAFHKETGKYPVTEKDNKQLVHRCTYAPEIGYSLLRRCLEDGDFNRAPLATHIANRILEAVEYFSPGLTRNPDVINKIYAARQGLCL